MKKLIQEILTFFAGTMFGMKFAERILAEPLRKKQEEAAKYQLLFQMMGTWMELRQKGISVSEYFERHGYKRIAIYGMSLAGQTLYNELKGTDIQVLYAIDRNKDIVPSEIGVYSPEELLPDTDVIIVSAITYYEEITEMLQEKMNCEILSLENIIYDMS